VDKTGRRAVPNESGVPPAKRRELSKQQQGERDVRERIHADLHLWIERWG
jgi:hypothetical protein